MEQKKGELLKIQQLSNVERTCYAYDGSLYVLDAEAEASDGFYLMHLITKDIFPPSSSETPADQGDAASIFDISDEDVTDTTAKRVVAVLPTGKLDLMKEAARNNKNAVCRIQGNQLLVRFKEQSPLRPEAVIQEEEYTEEERRVAAAMIAKLMNVARCVNVVVEEATSTTADADAASTSREQGADEDADDESDEKNKMAAVDTQTDINLVIEGKEEEMNQQYNKQPGDDYEQEGLQEGAQEYDEDTEEYDEDEVFLSAKEMKKLEGHRKAVPAQIILPKDFFTWEKRKQINHVCQERMRILHPDKKIQQTKKSSKRSKIASRREAVIKMEMKIEEWTLRAAKEEGEGRHSIAKRTRQQIARKYEKIRKYADQIEKHDATKSKPGKPTKYHWRKDQEELSDVGENELHVKEDDSREVRKLRENLAKQKVINDTTCKAFMGVMSTKMDERAVVEAKSRSDVERLTREIAELKHKLNAKENSQEISDDLFKLILPDIQHENRKDFIQQLEKDVHENMDTCKTAMIGHSEEEIKRRVKIAEDEAAERACEVHRLNKARETALYDRIDALKRQLKVEQDNVHRLAQQNHTLGEMLVFPNHASKRAVMLWKGLMAKRRRSMYGFPFDPTYDQDIHWEDEYSSGDYDSEDEHSSVASYCTDNETTDDEDEGLPQSTVAVDPVQDDVMESALSTGKRVEDDESEDLSETDSVTDKSDTECEAEEEEAMEQPPPVLEDEQQPPALEVPQPPPVMEEEAMEQAPPALEDEQQPPAIEVPQSPPALEDEQQPPALEVPQPPPVMEEEAMEQAPPALEDEQQPPTLEVPQPPPVLEDEQQPPALDEQALDTPKRAHPDNEDEHTVKKRRIEVMPAPEPTAAEEAFVRKHMRPAEAEPLHCRDEDAPEHPIEGKNLEGDKCLLNMQLLRDYYDDIPKENRDYFIKDDIEADDQRYDDYELDAARHIMWQDVKSLGYRWANRAAIGPTEMPVCHTYDEAEQQYMEVHERRMARLEEKAERLEEFENQEAERRLREQEPEEMEKSAKEKAEEVELEAKKRFRNEEVKVVKERTTANARVQKEEKRRDFIMKCRREVEKMSMEEVLEAENRIEDMMRDRFDSYIPLKYHLMMYQEKNIMKQHSLLTPQAELSVFNLYTGGEGQSREQMAGVQPRKESAAVKHEDSSSEDE